ncbi:cell division protein FtsB [Cognatilysobacter tabacisoli]|uniref:cell division protein FtsB n=1 Tax=Cognatilysobacter tabacisoli TaxID=2315424 RepID=UPI000E6AEAE0|nr:cell division protein FtsB [Lysobacter tabacisoli]
MPARWLRVLLVLLVALFAFLQYRLWLGEGGRRSVAALREQVEQQERENGGLQQRNDALAAEVEDLKSGEAAVEERARSELGMIRPGETFYRVVEPQGAPGAESPPAAGAQPPAPADAEERNE